MNQINSPLLGGGPSALGIPPPVYMLKKFNTGDYPFAKPQ